MHPPERVILHPRSPCEQERGSDYPHSNSIGDFSVAFYLRMFLRSTFSFKPTVLTAVPRREEVESPLCGVIFKTARWIRIALYAFKNSIANTI